MSEPTETSAGEALADERLARIEWLIVDGNGSKIELELLAEVKRQRFEIARANQEIETLNSEVEAEHREAEDARTELAELRERIGEEPRPILPAAMTDLDPEIVKQFQEEWDEAMAGWDGKLVIFNPPKVVRVEFGVRVRDEDPDEAIEPMGDVSQAQEIATAWRAEIEGSNPTVMMRTVRDVGQWKAADNA